MQKKPKTTTACNDNLCTIKNHTIIQHTWSNAYIFVLNLYFFTLTFSNCKIHYRFILCKWCVIKENGRVYQTNDHWVPSSNQIWSVFPLLIISVDIIITAQWSPGYAYLVQRDSAAARNHQMIWYVHHKTLYILTMHYFKSSSEDFIAN